MNEFQTPGYEHLQLSTQVLIAAALKRGIEVEVLDEHDNIIRLKKDGHQELIKEGTKTRLDSYVTSEVLGNKWVAKQLMEEAGIDVPKAKHYGSKEAAIQDWAEWENQAHVVKPTNTNYGIGITVHSQACTQSEYEAAIEMAFKEDNTALVETFIPGIECRFLVIDDHCVAVLNRIPANVTGDGVHSIEELVELKNQDPRRGLGHKTPLEKIQLGDTEIKKLSTDGLSKKSVPKGGLQILLRKNSNISTGGDSIDMSDDVHESYKQIAIAATKAVGANICGVDMILAHPTLPAQDHAHGIIEVNYNPVLYFHNFPHTGKNRHVGEAMLNALGY